MNLNSLNFKLVLASIYLIILFTALFFLFSIIDFKDLTNYDLIRDNRQIILDYKQDYFWFFIFTFFIFCILWTLLLGFAGPLLIFAGFVFGKWLGLVLVLLSTTIGAVFLYQLANLFFKNFIEKKFAERFSKLKILFNKNELMYFMCFRFIGGGGTPYGIQNILPVLFNMSVKNYVIATLIGSAPSMFITASLGSGIEKVIDKNSTLSFTTVIKSPEIYIPLIGFFIILIIAFIIKKIYFKDKNE